MCFNRWPIPFEAGFVLAGRMALSEKAWAIAWNSDRFFVTKNPATVRSRGQDVSEE